MKSIFIPLMGVAVFANQKLDQLDKFYDAVADISINVNDEYGCATSIANALDLLCDSFQYCEDNPMDYESHGCVDKDKFKTELESMCGIYDTFIDDIKIHVNKNAYDDSSHVALTFTATYTTKDDPCTVTFVEEHDLYFNDNGLITTLNSIQIDAPHKECPQDTYGGEKPLTTAAKHTNIPDEILEFYRLLEEIEENNYGDCQSHIGEMVALFDDSYMFCIIEKGQDDVCMDSEQYEVAIAKAGCGTYADVEYTLTQIYGTGDSYSPSLSFSYQVDYELKGDDGCTTKATRLETFEFNDQGLMTKRTEEIINEPVTNCPSTKKPMEYAPEPPQINKNDKGKKDMYSALNDKFARVMCKKHSDKMDDMDMKELFCEDMKYDVVCNDDNDDSDDCRTFKRNLHGRQAFLNDYTDYENLFDEAVYNSDDSMFAIKWRKGQCAGIMKQTRDLEYDAYRGCISKWTEYIEGMITTDKYGAPDCDNSPSKLYNKVVNECTFDHEPAQGYGDQMADLPPVAVSDSASTTTNTAVTIDVLANDHSPNSYHVDQDVLFIKSFTQGKKGEVVQEGDKLKYIPNESECGSDKFIYTVALTDNKDLTDSANVHIDIVCPQPSEGSYGMDTPPVADTYESASIYGPQQPMEAYGAMQRENENNNDKEEEEVFDVVIAKLTHVSCKKDSDKMDDMDIKQLFCEDMEYEVVCNNDSDDCKMFKKQLHGRQAFLNDYANYENLFDEAVYSSDDSMITTKWRKGQCAGIMTETFDMGYDSYRGCISKWTEYIEGMIITDKYGAPDCDNSPSKLYNKVANECTFDPEPAQGYGDMPLPVTAVSDSKSTTVNTAVTIDVLANDYSPKQDVLFIKSFTPANKGTVEMDGDKLKYTPYFDECGIDTFRYTVGLTDNRALTDSTVVHIEIACPQVPDGIVPPPMPDYNDEYGQQEEPAQGYGDQTLPPVAVSDSASTSVDTAVIIDVLDNDHSPNSAQILFIESFTQGKKGKVVEYGDKLKYIPNEGECGSDKFIYTVAIMDNKDLTDSANVHIDIVCPQTSPPPMEYNGNLDSMVKDYENGGSDGTNRLVKKEREDKLKLFYAAGFDCRLKRNAGNSETLDKFTSYLGDSSRFCITADNKCYDKNEIREMMGDRYSDDNESINYHVDIISNDGNKIKAKCTSHRRKSNGCIVTKEEYDECIFNSDGSIQEFTVTRSNRRTDCEQEDIEY